MKNVKIFGLSLMCAFCTNMQAQTSELEYRPFIEDGKNWSVQYGFEMSDNDYYYLDSDTLINGTTWKKVTVEHGEDIYRDYFAAVREEGRKVYAIKEGKTMPRLIYDFSLKVGDIVYLIRNKEDSFRWIEVPDFLMFGDDEIVGTMELTDIDVVRTLDIGWGHEAGVPFHRFTFKTSWTDGNSEPNTVIWIVGVGSDGGPFMPWHNSKELVEMGTGDIYQVACRQNKNTLFWGEEFYGEGEPLDATTDIFAGDYIDPTTKVVYSYNPAEMTAAVKAGYDMPSDFDDGLEGEILFYPGSPEASGDIAILDKFVVNGMEYTVTGIGMRAFCNNKNITSVTIPKTVTSIQYMLFEGCRNLTSVTSYIEDPFDCEQFDYLGLYDRATLYVPKGSKEKYEATNGWKQFKKIEEMETTGICDAPRLNDKGQMTNDKRGGVYDLQGRRLTQKPVKGVYIDNGRKRVVK